MPKINVYLPDELAEQVRHHGITVSAVCQRALTQEVKSMEAKEAATSDVEAVAVRLRQTITEEDTRLHAEGREDGAQWAKTKATWTELQEVSDWAEYEHFLSEDHSLYPDISQLEENSHHLTHDGRGWYVEAESAYWRGFIAAALEVRSAVAPLI